MQRIADGLPGQDTVQDTVIGAEGNQLGSPDMFHGGPGAVCSADIVRREKVAALRALIEAGEYRVAAEALAEKLLPALLDGCR